MVKLKDAIVVKNQFTNQKHSGYGKTLNQYIMRYVSRKGATEMMTPINQAPFDSDNYVVDYMARRDATEDLIEDGIGPERLMFESEQLVGYEGRAFGSKGVSYSEDTLKSESQKMQELFDSGHTVLKTVFSFRTNYLQDLGILPNDFKMTGRGSFKGEVDQLKLRQALNSGMSALTSSAGFSEPLWVGTVQVDTNHVHAHLVTSEEGERATQIQGEEKGKLSAKDMSIFRQRFDSTARELKPIVSYNQQVAQSRREVLNDVVNVVSNQYKTSSKLQLLVASLPNDTKYWRHDSHAKVMDKPKELMADYLQSLVEMPSLAKSFEKARDDIEAYATRRKELYDTPKKESINKGVSILESRLENGIYNHLKHRKLKLDTDTDYIKSQAEDDDVLKSRLRLATKSNDDVSVDLLAYRMNQYRLRLKKHIRGESFYTDADLAYDEAFENDEASIESRPIKNLYGVMREYHGQLADKYRYMLGSEGTIEGRNQLLPEQLVLHDTYTQLATVSEFGGYARVVDNSRYDELLLDDETAILNKNEIDTLVRIGQKTGVSKSEYNQLSQRLTDIGFEDAITFTDVSDGQYEIQRQLYTERLVSFNQRARNQGLVTQRAVLSDDGKLHDVESLDMNKELTPEYFDKIKALDMPDLAYDFDVTSRRKISEDALDSFAENVSKRRQAYDDAIDYLAMTNQNPQIFDEISDRVVSDESALVSMTVSMVLPQAESYADSYATIRNLSSISLNSSRQEQVAHESMVVREALALDTTLENDLLVEEAEATPKSETLDTPVMEKSGPDFENKPIA